MKSTFSPTRKRGNFQRQEQGMSGAWTSGRIGIVLLLTICMLTGCRGLGRGGRGNQFDPMLGDQLPPPRAPAAGSTPLTSTTSTNVPVNNPLPVKNDPETSRSNAELAGANVKSASKLRIASGEGTDVHLSEESASNDVWRGSGDVGATLKRPQPVRDLVSAEPMESQPIRPVGGLSSQIGSVEQGINLLDQRKAIGTRLDREPGGRLWRFSTAIPNPENPRLRKVYVGTGDDPLTAVRYVLDKIEREEQQMEMGN